MDLAKRFLLLSAAFVAVLAHAATPASNDRALQLLVRSLDRTSLKNIVAVMQMPQPNQGSKSAPVSVQVVQVVIAMDGRQKMTVLEPLQQSGLVIVQDGGTRQIYNPDARTLTTAPADDFFDSALRRKLISANYEVTMKENLRLAGVGVTRISAKSKRIHGLSTEIFVDPTSLFVLKVIVHKPPNLNLVRFDTRSIAYPEELEKGAFTIVTPQGVTSKPSETPVPVNSPAEARIRALFKPITPGQLPCGFIVHRTYVKKGADYRLIGFELTDGLAMATVIEIPQRSLPATLKAEMNSPQSEYKREGSLYIGIFTDLTPDIRKRLLSAYHR